MKTTIENLLIEALERVDRARKILSTQPDDWQLLNTAAIRLRLNATDARFSSINKAKGDTPSSAHSYTEGSEEPTLSRSFSIIETPPGFEKVYLCRGNAYKTPDMPEPKKAHKDAKGYFFFKRLTFVPCNHCDESGCTFNCIGKPKVKATENNVINFLLGECPLDGHWYGNSYKGQQFWWRTALRTWVANNAVGPAVHPYPETLQSKLDDLSKAWKTFMSECKEAVYPSTLTMEQKVAAARELWNAFIIEDCDGVDMHNFEQWLNKKK